MSAVKSMLEFLCTNRWQLGVAETILQASEVESPDIWQRAHEKFLDETRAIGFDNLESVAGCHGLCIAVAPICASSWIEFVQAELLHRALNDYDLDAYVVGSQIGLFRAGTWLQQHRKMVLGPAFLPNMGLYCLALLSGKKRSLVNTSGGGETDRAQQALDSAVKAYLRPKDSTLALLIRPHIRKMLDTMRQNLTENVGWRDRPTGPESWLFNSLVHGALNIENRNRLELLDAARAMIPVPQDS